MIQVKVGPVTFDVEAPQVEGALAQAERLAEAVKETALEVRRLRMLVERQPRVVFMIGPVSDQ